MSLKAKIGAGIVAFYLAFALIAPYMVDHKAIENWYSVTYWSDKPKFAPPKWVNLFGENLPPTENLKVVKIGEGVYRGKYDFHYSEVPTDVRITFKETPGETVTVNVTTPHGRAFTVYSGPPVELDLAKSYPVVQSMVMNSGVQLGPDEFVTLMATGKAINIVFARKEGKSWVPVRGRYTFTVEASSKPEIEIVGKTYGILGTDALGRDLWSAFLWGTRQTLIFVFAISGTAVALGTLFGLAGSISGRLGSAVDFISRVSTMLPMIPILIAMVPIFKRVSYYGSIDVPIWVFALVLGFLLFGRISRNVKTMANVEKKKEYVRASRILGGGEWWIVHHHVLRIIMPYSISEFIILSAKALGIISILGFFRVMPGFNWGSLLTLVITQRALYGGAWWMVLPAGGAIATLAIGFVLIHLEVEERFINPWRGS
jgi:peptide/nickel transport system permease protein